MAQPSYLHYNNVNFFTLSDVFITYKGKRFIDSKHMRKMTNLTLGSLTQSCYIIKIGCFLMADN